MTSKKSFLVNIKTNARRRVWLLVIMVLSLTFSMPILLAMMLSTEKMYYNYNNLPVHLGRVFANQIGLNGGMSFLVSILAIIAAIQGFSYMYQRKKLDMYMSVPVSKESRFAVIYLNGILVFLVPYLVNVGLSFLVAQTMGANTFLALGEAAAAMIGNCILYLAVYHIAILAVMLTGNLIVTVMGTGVMLFYDALMLLLIDTYKSTFFSSYYYKSEEKMHPFFVSPVVRFSFALDKCFTYTYGYTQERVLDWGKFLSGMVPVVAVSAITLVLAYWCYTKKPAEACGKAMAFSKTKGIIKILITVMSGLSGGIIFYGLSGSNMVFFVFGLVAGTLLCHGVVEVIYDFDIRSVKNGWKSLLISGGIVAAIFCIFQFDLTGYDSYVPEAEEIESVAFLFPDTYDTFYEEDLEGEGFEEYALEHMKMTDIQPVLELAQRRMGLESGEDETEAPAQYRRCVVKYRLKNGNIAYRDFPAHCNEDRELLDAIVTDAEYQKSSWLIFNEPLMNLGDKLDFVYDNGASCEDVTAFTLEELKNAYQKDVAEFTFTDLMEQRVQGRFSLESIVDGEYVGGYLPVYPSFENVNALLKEAGMYRDGYVDPDDVEQIIIRNDNVDLYEIYAEDEYVPYRDFEVEETFDDRAELEQIVPALYPDTFTDYWVPDGTINTGIYATVIYKSDVSIKSETYVGYYMQEELLPDFVRERTQYTE